MKLLKGLSLITLAVFIVAFVACSGSGQYAAEKKLMKQASDVMGDFISGMEKADNAKEVASVLNTFADKMTGLAPKMKEMEKKYPKIEEAPEELSVMMKDIEAMQQKMMGAMMKIMQYQDDPDVKAAQEKLEKIGN
jgi:predicted DNA-binding protein (UPF0251 family)